MLSPLGSLGVALLYDQYWFAVPGSDLLHGVHTLGEDVISHHDHDDGHCGVHQSQWPVFQLPCLDPFTTDIVFTSVQIIWPAFTVHVGELLHLQSTF